MKLALYTLFLLIASSISSFGQQNTFNWNDTVFHIGSKRISRLIEFKLDSPDIILDPDVAATLDTITYFLKQNPMLKVEIIFHSSDYRGSYSHNMSLSRKRAKAVMKHLISKGVDSARLVPKGYLIPPKHNVHIKTADAPYSIPRWVEIKILATDYGHETFNWNDTRFYVGSKKFLNNISFTFDKNELTSLSKIVVDTIAKFLHNNPALKIEIGINSDQRERPKHSTFTQEMARRVVSYLMYKGVDSARLVPKGYGFTKPIIPMTKINKMKTKEEQEAAYKTNRRTEITILATDYKKP